MKITINKFTKKMLKNAGLKIEKVEINGDMNGTFEFYVSFKNTDTKKEKSVYIWNNIQDLK